MNIKSIATRLMIGYIFLIMISCNSSKTGPEPNVNGENATVISGWQDQKFSMFIHWGLYSIPAGIWNGKQISGYSEQIKGHAKIPTEEYQKLAAGFNPTMWDADSIVSLAKKAGMKSIIITSKHHDGFCMFESEYTQFDIVDATPYKKDIIKDLADACKQNGLKFGVYFSLIDWDYDGAMPFMSTRNSDSIPPKHHEYNLNQIRELLTNYGEISELWFDMGAPTYKQSAELVGLVKELQPHCMVSGRIWNDQGDFVVMGDNYQPEFKMGVPWQTPASMFDETWGYRSWQERPDVEAKINEKIHDLLNIVSSGGNYLLNIGPKADGTVVPFERQVLEGIGQWLEANGEAIYSAKASPVDNQEWGLITSKPGKLYLHLTQYPENNKLTIKGLNADIIKAAPLADTSFPLNTKITGSGLEIHLSDEITKDKYATVIVLEYKDELTYISPKALKPNENGAFVLTPDNAEKYHSYSGHDYYSTKPTVIKLTWDVLNDSKEPFEVKIAYPAHIKDKRWNLTINDEKFLVPVLDPNTNLKNGTPQTIGLARLHTGKINRIELSSEDQSNPHKGLNIDGLRIMLSE